MTTEFGNRFNLARKMQEARAETNRFEIRQNLTKERDAALLKRDANNRDMVDVQHKLVGAKKLVDSDPVNAPIATQPQMVGVKKLISAAHFEEAKKSGFAVWQDDPDSGVRIAVDNTADTPMLTRNVKSPLPNKRPAIAPVLVHAQNVHDYFMAHHEEHDWMELTPLSCVRPPYERMVFTYDHLFIRDALLTENTEKILGAPVEIKGPVPETLRHVDVVLEAANEERLRELRISKVSFADGILTKGGYHDGDEVLLCTILDDVKPDGIVALQVAFDGNVLPGHMFVMYDATGQVLTWQGIAHIFIRTPSERETLKKINLSHEVVQAAFQRHTAIAMTAVNFMNCRNVEVVDNPPTRQQRRHAEREGKRPPVTYKTLVIHPMERKRSSTVSSNSTGAEKALHICRGHFKRYDEGKGLGRYHVHGVYWWAPSVRGNAERGRVVKDYDVEVEK